MEFLDKYYRAIRISYVVFIFIVILIFNKTVFGLISLEIWYLLYSVFNFLLILISYFIINQVFSLKLRFFYRFILFLLVLFLLYFLVFFLSIQALAMFKNVFPENMWIIRHYNYYKTSSFSEFFVQEKFSWMSGYFYFHLLFLFVGGVVDRYRSSLKRNMELQSFNSKLELDILKSQIEPHFLFNTLNNIYRLVIDNDKASSTVLKLSDLLRFSLYESNLKLIPIIKVAEFLESYIELEKIRHHSNVNIQYDFTFIENKDFLIAPLLFINFVENAFKHGVHHTIESTFVYIKLSQKGNELVFNIENKIPVIANKPKSSGGMGIENVKRRLQLLYPDQHEIEIINDNDIFTVNLKIYTT